MTNASSRPPMPADGRQRPPDPSRRALSLERKLPLLMTGVLAVVLATSLALTYRTLARTARATAVARLTQVVRLLATTSESANRARIAVLQRVAADTGLRRALREARTATATPASGTIAAARAALARVPLPTDSGLPVTLWTADGRRVASVGDALDVVTMPEVGTLPQPAMLRVVTDSVRTSPMYLSGGRVYFQVVAPVDEGRERLGYVVALRRVNTNPRITIQLHDLTGEDVAVYARHHDGTQWVSLQTGRPATPPQSVDAGVASRPGLGTLLTTSAPIAATPWVLTLEEPLSSVLRAPRQVLVSLASLAVLLAAVGAVASWLISRRIARPIASLTAAAEAMARGDYRSRVTDGGGDEVGRLARSFNVMAVEVDDAQQALARQFAEARAVADELARANAQLQQAMHQVEEARDTAEQANRAKSDFLAVMSHELRTPLNAIGGYTDLMQLGIYGPVTEQQANALGRVARSQQHLLGLINDVLNFAKLSAAKIEFDLRDVPLRDALGTVETMIAPQLEAKSLRYAAPPCEPPLIARADREKVQQVLLNLLSNAVKFTPAGGAITVTCERTGETVEVAVRDTGVGIPVDRLPHIFEPFVQVDRALNRPHEGVGLGLAISHDLARGMGGELRAESVLGNGSIFTLRLPAA